MKSLRSMFKNVNGGYYSPPASEARVINSDALIQDRLNEMMAQQAAEEETLYDEDEEAFSLEPETEEETEFLEGVEALVKDEDPAEEVEKIIEEANRKAAEILDQANLDAQAVLEEARNESEQLLSSARQEGYDAGMSEATAEIEAMRTELEEKKLAWENEKMIQQAGMERDLVDKILSVVDRVFHMSISDRKNMILQMVTDAISGIEGAKNFTIRVSPENIDFMESIKDSLQKKVGSGITIEVTSDSTLDDMGCMIETEGGLYDCSPFKEFDNLVRDIRILAAK